MALTYIGMNPFQSMLRQMTSSPQHNQMMRFVTPLNDHFGINHFWYYRITFSGNYSYLGTHSAWNEYCFDKSMLGHFSCLRHPDVLPRGISLMKKNADEGFQNVLKVAWEKFRINFNINLAKSIPEGIEAFGFAMRFDDQCAEERLLNHLPLLRHFTTIFRERHPKLFHLLHDHQVNLSSYFGPTFYERSKGIAFPLKRDHFLSKIGLESIFTLTPRELDIVKLISNGYPASYIAEQLHLCRRTVENYIATIKGKLSCNSKVELIRKAQEIATVGYFDDRK